MALFLLWCVLLSTSFPDVAGIVVGRSSPTKLARAIEELSAAVDDAASEEVEPVKTVSVPAAKPAAKAKAPVAKVVIAKPAKTAENAEAPVAKAAAVEKAPASVAKVATEQKVPVAKATAKVEVPVVKVAAEQKVPVAKAAAKVEVPVAKAVAVPVAKPAAKAEAPIAKSVIAKPAQTAANAEAPVAKAAAVEKAPASVAKVATEQKVPVAKATAKVEVPAAKVQQEAPDSKAVTVKSAAKAVIVKSAAKAVTVKSAVVSVEKPAAQAKAPIAKAVVAKPAKTAANAEAPVAKAAAVEKAPASVAKVATEHKVPIAKASAKVEVPAAKVVTTQAGNQEIAKLKKVVAKLKKVAEPIQDIAKLKKAVAKLKKVAAANAASAKAAPSAPTAPAAPAASVGAKDDDAAKVAQLRAQLEKISGGLTNMLSQGALSKTKVASTMTAFNTELQRVLKETERPKDMKAALKQLLEAQSGVRDLAQEVTNQQVRLMTEGEEQQESLLLGILMHKQKEPMAKQLEVLKSAEFVKLRVVAAVLNKKDTTTPLFKQVATYLDSQSPSKALAVQKQEVGKNGKPDIAPIVLALKAHLQRMEENQKHMEQHHAEHMKVLEEVGEEQHKKNATKAASGHVEKLKHREERTFAKQSAVGKHDIETMKAAISAVEKGDVAALEKAQSALNASLKAAQAASGKFLVLIELVHRAQGLDCPYCVAQCVDKCHTAGNPYTACLTECADAGK